MENEEQEITEMIDGFVGRNCVVIFKNIVQIGTLAKQEVYGDIPVYRLNNVGSIEFYASDIEQAQFNEFITVLFLR